MSTAKQRAAALSQIGPPAFQSLIVYGMPMQLTIAQAMIETGWMTKVIGRFNCFGMKKAPRHSKSVTVTTRETLTAAQLRNLKKLVLERQRLPDGRWTVVIEDEFADYDSLQEAVDDHARLISRGQMYAKAWQAFVRDRFNWQTLARQIAPIYATGSGYADLVIKIGSMKQVQAEINKHQTTKKD